MNNNNNYEDNNYEDNNYENTYDIEFCVSVPVFFRVQAHTIEQAIRMATEHIKGERGFMFKPANFDRDIVMIRQRKDICDLSACSEDMLYEYKKSVYKERA